MKVVVIQLNAMQCVVYNQAFSACYQLIAADLGYKIYIKLERICVFCDHKHICKAVQWFINHLNAVMSFSTEYK